MILGVVPPAGTEAATSESAPSRKALEEAYHDATRAASRMAMMGALGFGVALVMGAMLVTRGGLLSAGFGVELILLVGGLAGGVAFTALAMRASRIARQCRRRLDGRHGRGGSDG